MCTVYIFWCYQELQNYLTPCSFWDILLYKVHWSRHNQKKMIKSYKNAKQDQPSPNHTQPFFSFYCCVGLQFIIFSFQMFWFAISCSNGILYLFYQCYQLEEVCLCGLLQASLSHLSCFLPGERISVCLSLMQLQFCWSLVPSVGLIKGSKASRLSLSLFILKQISNKKNVTWECGWIISFAANWI